MNLKNRVTPPEKAAGSWPKRVFTVLLVLIILAAFAGSALLLPQAEGLRKSLKATLSKTKKKKGITFQGTMRGEKGSLAIVNDQMAADGAEIDGVRIVEIKDDHTLIIEHQGKQTPLTTGQTYSTDPD